MSRVSADAKILGYSVHWRPLPSNDQWQCTAAPSTTTKLSVALQNSSVQELGSAGQSSPVGRSLN